MSAAFLTKPSIDRPVRTSPRPMAWRAEAPNVDDGLKLIGSEDDAAPLVAGRSQSKGAVADSRT